METSEAVPGDMNATRLRQLEGALQKPTRPSSLRLWAMRAWTDATPLDGMLAELERKGRVRRFDAPDGPRVVAIEIVEAPAVQPVVVAQSKGDDMAKDSITRVQAAELLGCSESNVRQLIYKERIKSIGLDVDRKSVEAWKARGPKGSKPPRPHESGGSKLPPRPMAPKLEKIDRMPVFPRDRAAAPKATPAQPGDLHGKIRALLQVVDLQVISESVAFDAIRGLVG